MSESPSLECNSGLASRLTAIGYHSRFLSESDNLARASLRSLPEGSHRYAVIPDHGYQLLHAVIRVIP